MKLYDICSGNNTSSRIIIITLASLFLSSVFVLSANVAEANHATLTKSLDTGTNTISYRDVNIGLNSTASISLSSSTFRPGQTVTVTVTDTEANLDPTATDTITASASSTTSDPDTATINLSETGTNSGTFQGILILSSSTTLGNELLTSNGDDITTLYNAEFNGVGRLSTVLSGVSGAGSIEFSDYIIDSDTKGDAACPFVLVTHPVIVDLPPGVTATGATVTISYANSLIAPTTPNFLQVLYRSSAGSAFVSLTPPDGSNPISGINLAGHDFFVTKTVTSIDQPPSAEGQFALGYNAGCTGGGAGGLVRPGLVINALAGIGFFGGGGKDVSPPSLVFNKPSATGLNSVDSTTSTFSLDPYEPIEPSTDSAANAPVVINDNRYQPTGYANTFVPTQVNTGENIDMTLIFLEASSVKHVALHFVDENKDELSDRDPMITFDNGNMIKSDPDGILGDDIMVSTSRDGIYSKFHFGFSFNEPTKRHLMITAWDETRNSANTKMFNAFDVTGEPIPEEKSHLILSDLGQYIITTDGVIDIQAQSNIIQQEPVVGFAYTESLGRLDRHEMTKLYNAIDYEQKRASNLVIDNFNLDTKKFAADDETKPYDISSKRAPQLTWSHVGHKLRDLSNTAEYKELIKDLCWQEHLKAEKILKSLSKTNHQDD